ncbi:hypothetical protein WJX82_008845 [Trebouxia sp. C0006]
MLTGSVSAQNSLPAPATSDRLYLNYNSVNESLDVTTNNKAWYPDLGSVVSTHHNRMANILTGESFTVLGRFQSALYASCSSVVFTMRVAWLASSHVLSHEGRL